MNGYLTNKARQHRQLETLQFLLPGTASRQVPPRYADHYDIRHSECASSYSAYNRRWRAKKVQEFARCLAKADKIAQEEGLVTAMVRRLGGLEAFTRLWFENIQAARPGSRLALSSFLAISNMMRQADAVRPKPKAPAEMTVEEIDAEILRSLEWVFNSGS